jgi:glycine/D-amino acid oxidase-like deaminating enzyme
LRRKLLILGGGIKGTALAALVGLTDEFDVTLLERKQIGSGTTSTNHGRLHLGTSGWRKESSELIQRRRQASEFIRFLPASTSSHEEGIYCFRDAQEASDFVAICQRDGIPAQDFEKSIAQEWVDIAEYARVIQVPEFSFNPARLAGRFAQTCVNLGGTVMPGAKVRRITRTSSNLAVGLEDGSQRCGDIVVNTLTRWSNDVLGDNEMPRLEIKWFRWRLLCLRSAAIDRGSQLKRVTVVMDRRRTPSAIPHGEWITLDYGETELEEINSAESDAQTDWRPLNLLNGIDAANYDAVRAVFHPIQSLAACDRDTSIYSMAGVHGRLVNAKPGSTAQIISADAFPGYFLTFGGQASTALLDALEIVEHFGNRGLCRKVQRADRLKGHGLGKCDVTRC